MEHLSLMDVMIICKKNRELEKAVGKYFHSATTHNIKVTIDGSFLREFPVARHRNLYRDLGENTRELILSQLSEQDVQKALVYFKNITTLTLRDLGILTIPCITFPNNIKSLSLVNCCIDPQFLDTWFTKMGKSLESLHLQRVLLEFPAPTELSFLDRVELHHLTLEDLKVDTFHLSIPSRSPLQSLILKLNTRAINIRASNGNQLKRLEINCKADIFLTGDFDALQHLFLKCGTGKSKRDHLSTLKCVNTLTTLVYHHLPSTNVDQLLRFKNLQRIKVPCNWFDAEEWREKLEVLTDLSELELICHPPTPGYTLDGSLNDDLLRRILSYLPAVDCLNLGRVFPRLLTLFDGRLCLTVDRQFLKAYPIEEGFEEFYQCLSVGVCIVKVSSIEEKDFLGLMKRFGSLKELRLEGMRLEDVEGIAQVPVVEKLRVECCSGVGEIYWTELFRHLDGQLKSLTLEEPNYPLQELHGLVEFAFESYSSAEAMSTFLEQNHDLRKLTLSSHRSRDPFLALDKIIGGLPLEEVNLVVMRFEQILPVLDGLAEDTLTKMKVSSYSSKGDVAEPLVRFKNLQELDIDIAVDWTGQNLKYFSAFGELNNLRINGRVTEAVILEIVEQLPRLQSLELGSQVEPLPFVFQRKLLKYLRTANRSLCFNKNDAFSRWWLNPLN